MASSRGLRGVSLGLSPPAPDDWRFRAACGRSDPALFDTTSMAAARAPIEEFCDACPVRAKCLAWVRGEARFEGIAAGRVWTRHSVTGHRRSREITRRPDTGRYLLRFHTTRPPWAGHLFDPDELSPFALCGHRTPHGESGPDLERLLTLPACAVCFEIAQLPMYETQTQEAC